MKKWMTSCLCGFIILMFIAKSSNAQDYGEIEEKFDQLTLNTNPLFNYDIFNFSTPNPDISRVDIFISLSNELLQFVKQSETRYLANFEINITVYENKKKEVKLHQSFEQKLEEHSYQRTIDRGIRHHYFCSINLEPKQYMVVLELVDLDTRKSLHWESRIKLKTFRATNFNFSDIVFYQIDTTKTISQVALLNVSQKFFQQTPYAQHPQLISPIIINQRKLYIIGSYFGIYHEVFVTATVDSLLLRYEIINTANRVVYKQEVRKQVVQQKVAGEFIIDRITFEPGEHSLRITVQNHGKPRYIQKRFFFTPALTSQNIEDYTDLAIKPLRYIASSEEYEQMIRAPENEKKALLDTFWVKHDPTPKTPENELRNEFHRRVNFANHHFFSLFSKRQGWETDQGRIFILYGPPDDVERLPATEQRRLHEIWTYRRENFMRRFIFVFKPEWGEFQLLTME